MCSVSNEKQCKGPDPPAKKTFWQFVKGFFSNSKGRACESSYNDRRTTGNLRTDGPGQHERNGDAGRSDLRIDSPWRQI